MTASERHEISHLLQDKANELTTHSKQDVWVQSVLPKIVRFDPSEQEAISIAKWVWIYAQAQNLDPALILALITVESRFDPFATSSVGAQGLMQVMPFWKKELGGAQDNLFDVSTNIRYGTAILRHYIKRYHGVEHALAAYNGSKGSDRYPNKIMSQIAQYQQ
ncbi:MAG: lytic transglycosylase domain-containing protein [Ghiorsea sp.]